MERASEKSKTLGEAIRFGRVFAEEVQEGPWPDQYQISVPGRWDLLPGPPVS